MATFKPGQSGNPAGKPKGTQHKLTRLKNALAAKEGPGILKDIANRARQGDPHLQALFVRYLMPKSKLIDAPVEREPLKSVEEAVARIAETLVRLEAGEIDFEEAQALIEGARAYAEARKTQVLEAEVETLRAAVARLTARVENGGMK